MPDMPLVVSEKSLKSILGLEKDIEYFFRVASPRAVPIAMRKVRGTMKSNITTAVWNDSKSQPLITSQGIMLTEGRTKAKLRRGTVGRRTFITNPKVLNSKTGETSMTVKGYVKPIPAASALAVRSRPKGESKTISTLKGRYLNKKTPGPRAKNQTPTQGGVKIRGLTMRNAFIQITTKSNSVQIFTRMQQKTWRPGKSGWKVKPGTNQSHLRMPYDVVKIFIEDLFNKHFYKQVEKTMNDRYEIEYERALGVAARRLAR